MLELRKHRKFLPSQHVHGIWITEANDEHLVEQAEYLKFLLTEEDEMETFLEKREGDYPPRTLND